MNEHELAKLAWHCNNGACNVKAIVDTLARHTAQMSQSEIRDSLFVKIVVGQLSFLLGESLGPSDATMQEFANYLRRTESARQRELVA